MAAAIITMTMTDIAIGQGRSGTYCPAGFVNGLAFGTKRDGVADDADAFGLAYNSGNDLVTLGDVNGPSTA